MIPGTAKAARHCGRSALLHASLTRTKSLASTRASRALSLQQPSLFFASASSTLCHETGTLSADPSSPQQQPTCIRQYHTTTRRLARRRNYSESLASRADTELTAGEDLTSFAIDGPMTMEELKSLASKNTTPLSLQNMYRYASVGKPAQRLRNAQFLHRELPIRIAQRAVDLLTLPHGLNNTPQVRSVANVYLKYLKALQTFPCPQSAEEEQRFTDTLRPFILDRTSIPAAVAAGISTLKDRRREESLDVRRLREMEDALYRFFTARVGLRFLTEHHILSDDRNQEQNDELRIQHSCLENVPLEVVERAAGAGAGATEESFLGCIQKNCDPVREAERVADQVQRHCEEAYGISPDIDIVDCTSAKNARRDFTYVPHHLQYMLSELLKNSCRASVRKYLSDLVSNVQSEGSGKTKETPTVPSIRVVIVKGAEDVTIKIADKAGGIPRSDARKVWSFAHTNMDESSMEKEMETDFETDEFTGSAIRGFGLPLARIYARYFGGELTIKSMEGFGVDAYIYLPVLGAACENLPQRVTQSPGNLDSNPSNYYYGGGGGSGETGDSGDSGDSGESGNSTNASNAYGGARGGEAEGTYSNVPIIDHLSKKAL
mmetsp:Transcript_10424/g.29310  ORF Transcript_10424/g.29310 Transcript_10424/m.29310 type:complete len:606 (-) Transcript_10424:1949-3766(-)